MRKIIVMILAFLFITTLTGYATGVNDNTEKRGEGTSGQYGALYGNRDSNTAETGGQSGGGLFRSPDDDFGERPGGGGGIGQEAPLGDGLHVIAACCVVLIVVKSLKKKKNNNR